MKKKIRLKLPISVFIVFAAVLVLFSIYISPLVTVPAKIVYISSLFAMPEGMNYKISQIKNNFLQKTDFFSDNEYFEFSQKDGSVNDLTKVRDFKDLTVTPDDISENMKNVQQRFNDGKYKYDGVTVERTFVDNQSTDSYENIYIRNVTVDSEINIESIVKSGCILPITDFSEPTVLIYHTHSTESYIMTDNGEFSSAYPSRSDDKNINMVRIGDEISAVLEANGIGVIHDRTIYDTTYTGAYAKSREGILKNLKTNPSIVITLDIHRDAVHYDDYTRVKPTVEIEGMKAAQLMIITGAEGGSITDFPDWKTNLSFAVNLQKTANSMYENLMKPIYFSNRKYNMDATPYSLLIEVGTDVNTLAEAAYSGRLLGDVLSDYIKQHSKDDKND